MKRIGPTHIYENDVEQKSFASKDHRKLGVDYSGASPMASSSSSRLWKHDVFVSFRGEDVRRTFLSHLRQKFKEKGIETYEDDGMNPGTSIPKDLVEAIEASKVFLVLFSKNYASSSWCLNELVEIDRCRKERGLTIIPIFYEVDPSNVRKQDGAFRKAFKKTCREKTKKEKETWTKTLKAVANTSGVHSRNWDNEADMIEKIARDISNELNSGASGDFDSLVGMEGHLKEMNSLLSLDSDEVRMVGIWGPAGIGKSTVARALFHRLSGSNKFQNKCLMGHIRGTFGGAGLDKHSLELHLQEQFLSEMFNEKDLRIRQPGVILKRLHHRKVLVILDDVDKPEQLNALIKESAWFGPGSRIIVTTEDKGLLIAHEIKHIYEVKCPSREEALEIFCLSAFKQQSPSDGFEKLAFDVVELAGRLPLGLRVLGSSLCRCSKEDWELALPRLRTTLDGDIMKVLRVGYDTIHYKDQAIFRHIACRFHGNHVDYVKKMLDPSDLNVGLGLNVLIKKSLIRISYDGCIAMHRLLQQMGREVVRMQSIDEPGKREFLWDAKEVYDVLTDNTGTETVLSISLNMGEIPHELVVSSRAFEGMRNLQFLEVHKNFYHSKNRLHVPATLDFLPRKLRLLHWDAYPLEGMPSRFHPECLVELNMRESKLKKLWEGAQPLMNLKKIDLESSMYLEEIPDLSKATRLGELRLSSCESLAEIPPFIRHLSGLTSLYLDGCIKLDKLPSNIDLESLEYLDLGGCKMLKTFPEISRNIERLFLNDTAIEHVPSSTENWSRLVVLNMSGCKKLRKFPQVAESIDSLYLSGTGIEEVPAWVERLFKLSLLDMMGCTSLRNVSSNVSKLKCLRDVNFSGCSKLMSFPAEMLEAVSVTHMSLSKNGCRHLPDIRWVQEYFGTFQQQRNDYFYLWPPYVSRPRRDMRWLDLSGNDFKNIPLSIKLLSKLYVLNLSNCKKLISLPELPKNLSYLYANGCVSLERIFHFFDSPTRRLAFGNCIKLDQKAREFIQQMVCTYSPSKPPRYAYLPGGAVPKYFTHKASGCSLDIDLTQRPVSGFLGFKACIVLSLERHRCARNVFINFGESLGFKVYYSRDLILDVHCSFIGQNGDPIALNIHRELPHLAFPHEGMDVLSDHLFIFNDYFTKIAYRKVSFQKVSFRFGCNNPTCWKITEFGVQLVEGWPNMNHKMYPQLTWKKVGEIKERNNDMDRGYETEDSALSGDTDVSNDIDTTEGHETAHDDLSADSDMDIGGGRKAVQWRDLVLRAQKNVLGTVIGVSGSLEVELETKETKSRKAVFKRGGLVLRRNKRTTFPVSKFHRIEQCFRWT